MSFETLNRAGIDMDAFLRRLMGNEALVRVFIKKFLDDQNFAGLQAAFRDGDLQQAELCSHTLKGMCGNLSLTELFGLFSQQVNLIRAGEGAKAEAMMGEITAKYESATAAMKDWLAE